MRYLLIHKLDETRPEAWNPSTEFVEAMGAFMTECAESGVLLAAEGVHESSEGAIIRKRGSGTSVIDGPFTEAKELIGGYAVIEVHSRAEALELARRVIQIHADHWPKWNGSCELRQIGDPPAELAG